MRVHRAAPDREVDVAVGDDAGEPLGDAAQLDGGVGRRVHRRRGTRRGDETPSWPTTPAGASDRRSGLHASGWARNDDRARGDAIASSDPVVGRPVRSCYSVGTVISPAMICSLYSSSLVGDVVDLAAGGRVADAVLPRGRTIVGPAVNLSSDDRLDEVVDGDVDLLEHRGDDDVLDRRRRRCCTGRSRRRWPACRRGLARPRTRRRRSRRRPGRRCRRRRRTCPRPRVLPLAGSLKPEKSGGWVEVLDLDLDVRA